MKKNSKGKASNIIFAVVGSLIVIVLLIIVAKSIVLEKYLVCRPSCPKCTDCGGGYYKNYTLWDKMLGR